MKLEAFLSRFGTEEACRAHLEAVRWPHGPVCDRCGMVHEASPEPERPDVHRCPACGNDFRATVGTPMEGNRRFLQLCSHHLVEPTACTPRSGWEKGQVENQVNTSRERLFTPRLRFPDYAGLNDWLETRCLEWARETGHPEMEDRTVWQAFEAERPMLLPYAGPFDGFHEKTVGVHKTCLVQFDRNRYSVESCAVGRAVQLHAYAGRIVVRLDGEVVAKHPRQFGRNQVTYDPWHYVPVLARKPGALRNGAPFRDWELPAALAQVRRRLSSHPDGDRQFVGILGAVLTDGLDAVDAACAEALRANLFSRDTAQLR